jgi:5-carboxymethyl-2-hydroxymuconate isomerase
MTHPLMTATEALALEPRINELLKTVNEGVKHAAESGRRSCCVRLDTFSVFDVQASRSALAELETRIRTLEIILRERGYGVSTTCHQELMGSSYTAQVTW